MLFELVLMSASAFVRFAFDSRTSLFIDSCVSEYFPICVFRISIWISEVSNLFSIGCKLVSSFLLKFSLTIVSVFSIFSRTCRHSELDVLQVFFSVLFLVLL